MVTKMLEFLVIIAEVTLLLLLCWLVFTLYKLTRQNGKVFDEEIEKTVHEDRGAYSKLDSLTESQIFTQIQLMEAKKQGLSQKSMGKKWIVESSALYFMGAAKAISEHFHCDGSDTHEIMCYLLSHNLQVSKNQVKRFIQNYELQMVSQEDKESSETGRTAASLWLKNKFTPDENSLISTIRLRGIA